MTLLETLHSDFPDVDPETLRKIIYAYRDGEFAMVKGNQRVCDICLSGLLLIDPHPDHFNTVCVEHEKWAMVYQIEDVRRKLGFSNKRGDILDREYEKPDPQN